MKTTQLFILKKYIENIRNKINKLARDKNCLDEDIIELSQKLDKLINKYNNVKYNNYN